MLQTIVHYTLHFIFPGVIAWFFFRKNWKMVWLIMLATMLIDLDHLFASPIFDSNRCSINFHPFHTYWAFGGYVFLFLLKKTRIVGLGLLLHLLTDFIDCLFMN
jgi:hypothetical protein